MKDVEYKNKLINIRSIELKKQMPSWKDINLILLGVIIGIVSYAILNATQYLNLDVVGEIISTIFFALLPNLMYRAYILLKVYASAPLLVFQDQQNEIKKWKQAAGILDNGIALTISATSYRKRAQGESQVGIQVLNKADIPIYYCTGVVKRMISTHNDRTITSWSKEIAWGGMNDKKGPTLTLQPSSSEILIIACARDGNNQFFLEPNNLNQMFPIGTYQASVFIQGKIDDRMAECCIIIDLTFQGGANLDVSRVEILSSPSLGEGL